MPRTCSKGLRRPFFPIFQMSRRVVCAAMKPARLRGVQQKNATEPYLEPMCQAQRFDAMAAPVWLKKTLVRRTHPIPS